MNVVTLVGRLTKDIEIRVTQSNKKVAAFNLAVNRRLTQEQKNAGAQSADFVNCVAWEKTAEFLDRYCVKGNRIGIEGCLQTRTYDANGQKHYVTEVLCNRIELLSDRKPEEQAKPQTTYYRQDVAREANDFQTNLGGNTDVMGYSTVPPVEFETDDLPFY